MTTCPIHMITNISFFSFLVFSCLYLRILAPQDTGLPRVQQLLLLQWHLYGLLWILILQINDTYFQREIKSLYKKRSVSL